MADITQDSFDEAERFLKVLFQRGRNIRDNELNEFQDILRFMLFRQMANGIQKTIANSLNPGSNDTGYKIVGTSASNQVTVQAGYLFCDGIPVYKDASSTLSGFTTPGSDRTDTVYLSVTETEVSDPSASAQLGETSRRRQLQVALAISTTGPGGVPANTSAEIFEGGVHYFKLANIARTTGVATIAPGDVTDLRAQLPPQVIENLQSASFPGDSVVAAAAKTTVSPTGFFGLSLGKVQTQLQELLDYVNRPYNIRTITAGSTIGATDTTIVLDNDVTPVPYNLQLPNPSTFKGKRVYIADKIAGTNLAAAPVTLVRHGSEKIDGLAGSYVLNVAGGRWFIETDATDWYVFRC